MYRVDLKHHSTMLVSAASEEAALQTYFEFVPVPAGVMPVVAKAKPVCKPEEALAARLQRIEAADVEAEIAAFAAKRRGG